MYGIFFSFAYEYFIIKGESFSSMNFFFFFLSLGNFVIIAFYMFDLTKNS